MRSSEVIKKRNKPFTPLKIRVTQCFFVERRENTMKKRGIEKMSMQICRFDRWFSEQMYRIERVCIHCVHKYGFKNMKLLSFGFGMAL